jgi:ribosomal protein L30/L7E
VGDWLGTGAIADHLRQYRSFKKARAFVHRLGLKSQGEWRDYCKSDKKPADIPANPYRTYAKAGWSGFGDWFGTSNRRGGWRAFRDARAYVRRLGLISFTEWRDYSKSGKKPDDIPAHADRTYAEAGWAGWGDWLGTGAIADHLRQYRPFKKARAFVRGLGLKSSAEWFDYCGSGKKPVDIPAGPRDTYAEVGWAGMGDWLGTGRRRGTGWRPFKKARAFVRGLGLKSGAEWHDYCKSKKKPDNIPAHADRTYAEAGWAGMGNWLGTGRVANRLRQYRSFKKARAFVRGLGLKSRAEWFAAR